MEQIGDRIARLLKACDMSQSELAEGAGVTKSALSRYINNERQPRLDVLANIATILGTTSDYLINGKEDTNSFEDVYRFVARGTQNMSSEEKIKLMRLLLDAD